MQIQNSVNSCGVQNIPGILTKVWIVCECEVDVWPLNIPDSPPAVPAVPASAGDKLRLVGDITLKAGQFWAEFSINADTGEVKHPTVGNRFSKSFEQTFDFEKANTGAAVEEWFMDNMNACAICVVQEKNGDKRVIGWEGSPATFESLEMTSGKDSASNRVATAQIKAHTGRPAYYYTGLLPTAP